MNSELNVTYLGQQLKSPVIVGSCPLTLESETVRQLVDAGAGAIVLPSMLQEQISYSKLKPVDAQAAIENSGYQPQQDKYNGGVEAYLETIRRLKDRYRLPVFASINGASVGDWIDYGRRIEASGADALELNWQPFVMDPTESADEIEGQLCEIVRLLCATVSIPVAVKLNQRFTNLASIAHRLQDAGAASLVLFTHLPRWDVSVDRMHWTVRWELSPVNSLGTILEGIVRSRNGGLQLSIAASGGIRTSEDAIKAMIAGADVVMVTSEIYRRGPDVIRKIVSGIATFLDGSHYQSLQAFLDARPGVELGPQRLMRLEYVDPLTSSERYIDPTPVAAGETGDSFGHRK